MNSKVERAREVEHDCTRCNPLKVPSQYNLINLDARVLFVGPAPSLTEVREGRLFPKVSSQGQMFYKFLDELGISEEDVSIINLARCYTLDDPRYCYDISKYLIAQHSAKYIVTMGSEAYRALTNSEWNGNVVGKERIINGKFILPIYHPAQCVPKPDYAQKTCEALRLYRERIKNV